MKAKKKYSSLTSAALPLYNLKWLHALRFKAIALSGNCCKYTANTSCNADENSINPTALRKAKIVYNFGHSECNRVKGTNRNPLKGSNSVIFEFA